MNSFGTRSTFRADDTTYSFYSLPALAEQLGLDLSALPLGIRILLENLLRHEDGRLVTAAHVEALARWSPDAPNAGEIPFMPARVLMQDFTGVPSMVDLAAMRDTMARLGGDPGRITPRIPVDLVIDHSVQVDCHGTPDAFACNAAREMERNAERYTLLKWARESFDNLRVAPPATGICHQVNLEYLGKVVMVEERGATLLAYPDTLVGLDSHTTMINSLGVLGWGVGGIEAEAVLLGQPYAMLTPRVIGLELTGRLPDRATATDLVLTITHLLRAKGVVGALVEFFGPGLDALTVADRATISNMTPEFGATASLFPVDAATLGYLRLTGRDEAQVRLVETYCKAQGLFRDAHTSPARYSDTLRLDLATVGPTLAGPKRPQDPIALADMKTAFTRDLRGVFAATDTPAAEKTADNGMEHVLTHGDVVIAAITSCTNTSNPAVLLAAGLLAQKAVARGLTAKPWVKTSLAPGSKVVTDYLDAAGLTPALNALGFHLAAYGCTSCIGNSGPLPPAVASAIVGKKLVAAAVLSGNRNFEGRVHPLTRANYLASPPLVVAYALAGTVTLDLATEPLGTGHDGSPVFLADIWPSRAEIDAAMSFVTPAMFRARYADVFTGDAAWQALPVAGGERYAWEPDSTYLREPPFFKDMALDVAEPGNILDARVLALLGDSITTDHISPAGAIPRTSPAADHLRGHGVADADFNSYGSRRGNHRVMLRGTFGNVRLRNQLAPGTEGGLTRHLPTGEVLPIHDAAMRYREAGTPLIILAGKEYGTGSSRDWAAKGTLLLGVKAVFAQSFERIHRGNLVAMGVLPLEFAPGENAATLGLTGEETFHISGIAEDLTPRKQLTICAVRPDGAEVPFTVTARIDTAIEVDYYEHGGILPYVIRQMLQEG